MKEGYIPVSAEFLRPKVKKIYDRVRDIVNDEIIPIEKELDEWYAIPANRDRPHPKLARIKARAKAEGLWNLGITQHSDPTCKYGAGLTNVEFGFICEQLGRCLDWAPGVFNCSAPGLPDSELLLQFGSEEQKSKYLPDLLDGKGGSCFAMTEPNVASSDATNISSSIRRQGDHYIINGRKWWISGASDPKTKYCFFLGRTDPDGPRHRQHSVVIVPFDAPGVKIVRDLNVFGFADAPHGHSEILFENVKVPVSNLVHEEGKGFEVGQGRLGPARVHHCMRIIGAADRAIDLMVQRTQSRVAFGKTLSTLSSIQQDIAKSRVELEQAKMLVIKAAHMMDTYGNKVAMPYIAMIKLAVPSMACKVIDRAIQVHGGMGVCQDTQLPHFFSWARVMRIFDGPDEVHCRTIAGYEMTSKSKL